MLFGEIEVALKSHFHPKVDKFVPRMEGVNFRIDRKRSRPFSATDQDFGVHEFKFRISGFRFRVSGLGLWVRRVFRPLVQV